MPAYFAGDILASGSIYYGGGFTASRTWFGAYRIVSTGPTPSGKPFVIVVTPVTPNMIGRVVQYFKDNVTGIHYIDVEIRNLQGVATDAEFHFIAIERSGP